MAPSTVTEPASAVARSRSAVFVDRDGVINEERRDYVTHWDAFRFLPGAIEAVVALARGGLDVLIVTNQSAINRGIVSYDDVERLHRRMLAALRRAGGRVRGVYVCPHTPDEGCACRKPKPGLLLQAAREHHLDLSRCYLIGDKLSDMEAGQAAGCRCMLVLTGLDAPPAEALDLAGAGSFRVFPSIREAVDQVLADQALADKAPADNAPPSEAVLWSEPPGDAGRRQQDALEPVDPISDCFRP